MNSKKMAPNVSIAIPKAKPKMERVSPGVYRDSAGKLVRSKGASSGRRPPTHRPAPGGWTPLDPPMMGGLLDKFRIKPYPLPLGDNGFGARPIPKMPGRNIDPGFEVNPSDISPELRRILDGVMNRATPQTPRAGDSISDILRRFK